MFLHFAAQRSADQRIDDRSVHARHGGARQTWTDWQLRKCGLTWGPKCVGFERLYFWVADCVIRDNARSASISSRTVS